MSRGAGAIGSQSTSNLGGTVETFSMDPLDHFAAQANATYGSDETMRGFVRVNVGSADGFRGYISYAYGATDKYKGSGTQDQHMVNVKGVLPAGEGQHRRLVQLFRPARARAIRTCRSICSTAWATARITPIPIMLWPCSLPISAIIVATLAHRSPMPRPAPVYPGKYTSADDAYYDASGLRKDTLGALGYKTPLGETVNVVIKGYYHHNKGMGLWAPPYVPGPTGAPSSHPHHYEYDINRWGIFGSANPPLGAARQGIEAAAGAG